MFRFTLKKGAQCRVCSPNTLLVHRSLASMGRRLPYSTQSNELYSSAKEETLFTRPFSRYKNVLSPSFENQTITLKNTSPQAQKYAASSWETAIQNPVVRENLIKRWGLRQLSTIQKRILTLLNNRAIPKGNLKLSDMDPDSQLDADAFKDYLDNQIDTVTHDIQSQNDVYIQAEYSSGKLTATLAAIADRLLTQNPDLSPQPIEHPHLNEQRMWKERERVHPSAIIVTFDEDETVYAHRLAQRVFARTNVGVEKIFYDGEGKDVFDKMFTKGANVYVLDLFTLDRAVTRGWISARDLQYIVMNNLDRIASETLSTESQIKSKFKMSIWLAGAPTQRIALSTASSEACDKAAQQFLREDYVSVIANDTVPSQFYTLESLPQQCVCVAQNQREAEQLASQFEKRDMQYRMLTPDTIQNISSSSNISHGIATLDMLDNLVSASFPVVFYNYFDRMTLLNFQRKTKSTAAHFLTDEHIEIDVLTQYRHQALRSGGVFPKALKKLAFEIQSGNMMKDLDIEDYVAAHGELSSWDNHPLSSFYKTQWDPTWNELTRDMVWKKGFEGERNKREEKERAKVVSSINKQFRKTPQFREFFNLKILNEIDKELYAYIEKTILHKKATHYVRDILDVLKRHNIQWSSPATEFQSLLDETQEKLRRENLLSLSALKLYSSLNTPRSYPDNIFERFGQQIERYVQLKRLTPKFIESLKEKSVEDALNTIPSSKDEFAAWKNKLSNEMRQKLDDLSEVYTLMQDGITIPSVQPHPTQETQDIGILLSSIRSSSDLFNEWREFNDQCIEALHMKGIEDVGMFTTEEEKKPYISLWNKARQEKIQDFPLLIEEHELEKAFIQSQYTIHQPL